MDIFEACRLGDIATLATAINSGANINQVRNDFIQTPLEQACISDNYECAKYLLYLNANVTDRALTCCNDYEVQNILISRGANPNAKGDCGTTLLHIACDEESDPERVRYLLQHGADPNVVDDLGCTPLYLAAYDNPEIVQLLLHAGANPNFARTDDGETPLARARRIATSNPEKYRTREVVQLLSN